MQKKILIVVLVIAMLLSGCNYYYRSNQPEPLMTMMPTAQHSVPEFTEKVTYYPTMVDNNHFELPEIMCECDMASIAIESIEQSDAYINISYSIVNKDENLVSYNVQSLCINGYMITDFTDRYYDTEIPAGETVVTDSSIPLRALESLNIESIEEISLYYTVFDHADELSYKDTYTISTGNDYETYQLPEDSKLIAQSDDIDVCLLSMYGDEYYENIDFLVTNKTDERIFFGISGIALDGVSVPVYISEDLMPNAVYTITVKIPQG